jgi:hypothetical protein
MRAPKPSLSFRVRYEGRVQTFDRRPRKEREAERVKTPFHYIVAHTLSKFRLKTEAPPPAVGAAPPPTSAVARGK